MEGLRVMRFVRGVGWSLTICGAAVLVYVVYAVFLSGLETDRAQALLREDLGLLAAPETLGQTDRSPMAPATAPDAEPSEDPLIRVPGEGSKEAAGRDSDGAGAESGEVFAAIWFERPGSDDPPVRDDPLIVVEGVSRSALRRGPGHYPGTATPGGAGNVVISGHRTTYGAPFFRLDELRPDDRVHVLDRDHRRWVYEVREVQVVAPTALWVADADPLGGGGPTLTLTTCHPRFSSSQRLVVFADLLGGVAP